MGTLTASWTSKGVTHTVTTNQMDGESDAAFQARHNAAVAAQQEKYPPD